MHVRQRRGLFDARKIGVTAYKHVEEKNKRGHQGRGQYFAAQVLVDARLENGQEVLSEAIGIAVLFPVVVRVDGAAALNSVITNEKRQGSGK